MVDIINVLTASQLSEIINFHELRYQIVKTMDILHFVSYVSHDLGPV